MKKKKNLYQKALQPKVRTQKPAPKQSHEEHQMRLNKAIGASGYCSRREADQLIADGLVTVNGKPAVMGQYVCQEDSIAIKGKEIKSKIKRVYLVLNKPAGIECTTDTSVKGNIVDFINYSQRIFPIGRLDKASEGLIVMTNHGDIVNKVLRAGNAHEKEYIVTVHRAITPDFIKKMGSGIPILDTVTQPCEIQQLSKFVFRIILKQGLNRQIRRMCEYLGYEVTKLVRTRIMHIELGDLPQGKWRYLKDEELNQLMAAIEHSKNEYDE